MKDWMGPNKEGRDPSNHSRPNTHKPSASFSRRTCRCRTAAQCPSKHSLVKSALVLKCFPSPSPTKRE
eukprot:scaffold60986_cov41-Prasinocladus_malaysianus.AAC.1